MSPAAPSPLLVYTDGAVAGNPGPGGWSAVFVQDGAVTGEVSGGATLTTNNVAELTGVREALASAPAGVELHIHTDSKNVIGWLAGGWKRKDARIAAVCGEIDALIRARTGRVTFEYVRGHAGHSFNERADRLAVAARDKAKAALAAG